MKRLVCILLLAPIIGFSQNTDLLNLSGPYLGQTHPGMKGEIYAPDIVSTDSNEVLFGFFNDNTLLFFERSPLKFDKDWIYIPLFRSEQKNNTWTMPKQIGSLGNPWFYEYCEAPIGTKIFFTWKKYLDGRGPENDIDIWFSKKISKDWTIPYRLDFPVNTNKIDSWPSLSKDETLYFFSSRDGGLGKADLYCSVPHRGKYEKIKNLGDSINSECNDHDPFIALDGSYLIWCSDRPGGFGKNDLYISFRKDGGEWTTAINMSQNLNSEADETRPYVTSDGQFLFFNTNRNGNRDIYWVDASIIEDLKPNDLK